jgi:hypothetical protein
MSNLRTHKIVVCSFGEGTFDHLLETIVEKRMNIASIFQVMESDLECATCKKYINL